MRNGRALLNASVFEKPRGENKKSPWEHGLMWMRQARNGGGYVVYLLDSALFPTEERAFIWTGALSLVQTT
jgi:hypothetical protein